jgi:putative sigma-54 modulation protein
MRTIVRGKNYEVPDRVRQYAERKLSRLERMLDDRSEAIVELWVEQNRNADDSHIVEVTLVIDGQPLRGRGVAVSHTAGIDTVVDKIERQAVDLRKKPRARNDQAAKKEILAGIASGTSEPSRDPRIVKVKRFAIEPMFEEDALARMLELQHQFFVFVDAETERVNVLYRRKDGDFGLIEPIVGGDYTTSTQSRGGKASRH